MQMTVWTVRYSNLIATVNVLIRNMWKRLLDLLKLDSLGWKTGYNLAILVTKQNKTKKRTTARYNPSFCTPKTHFC